MAKNLPVMSWERASASLHGRSVFANGTAFNLLDKQGRHTSQEPHRLHCVMVSSQILACAVVTAWSSHRMAKPIALSVCGALGKTMLCKAREDVRTSSSLCRIAHQTMISTALWIREEDSGVAISTPVGVSESPPPHLSHIITRLWLLRLWC